MTNVHSNVIYICSYTIHFDSTIVEVISNNAVIGTGSLILAGTLTNSLE